MRRRWMLTILLAACSEPTQGSWPNGGPGSVWTPPPDSMAVSITARDTFGSRAVGHPNRPVRVRCEVPIVVTGYFTVRQPRAHSSARWVGGKFRLEALASQGPISERSVDASVLSNLLGFAQIGTGERKAAQLSFEEEQPFRVTMTLRYLPEVGDTGTVTHTATCTAPPPYTWHGRFVDAASPTRVQGVIVSVGPYSGKSDENGFFTIRGIPWNVRGLTFRDQRYDPAPDTMFFTNEHHGNFTNEPDLRAYLVRLAPFMRGVTDVKFSDQEHFTVHWYDRQGSRTLPNKATIKVKGIGAEAAFEKEVTSDTSTVTTDASGRDTGVRRYRFTVPRVAKNLTLSLGDSSGRVGEFTCYRNEQTDNWRCGEVVLKGGYTASFPLVERAAREAAGSRATVTR